MTKDELLNKAVYVQYPLNYNVYKEYGIEGINKLPLPEKGMMYDGYKLNHNHFRNEYHMKYSLPLFDSLLNFGYNENDFIKSTRIIDGFEIPVLIPKTEYKYNISCFNDKEELKDLSFNDITSSNDNYSNITGYHRLYKYPHKSSRLINKTLNNNRILFISGDSQMIPDIGVLSCYFKEIWYIDNRNNILLSDKWNNIAFTDVLIELNCNDLSRYIDNNFK